jgi:glycosyltransferase involved in cell wall biosynthesis
VTRTYGPNVALLSEAISSVCNQTYDRIEHLIVEDRTNYAEDMVQSLRELYGRDIRYIRSNGGGRSLAGNTGLENANGAFMMFLDNDDLLLADHVELLVRTLLDAPTAVAAYSRGWEVPTFYDQNGRYREDPPIHIPSHDGPFDRTRLEKGNFLPIQNVLFRRNLFEQHGGFDPEIDHLEDWNLWVRYAKSGDFQYVPKTTALYRVPGDTQWREARSKAMLNAENAVRAKNQEVTPNDFS